jgi:hypothetical protein
MLFEYIFSILSTSLRRVTIFSGNNLQAFLPMNGTPIVGMPLTV